MDGAGSRVNDRWTPICSVSQYTELEIAMLKVRALFGALCVAVVVVAVAQETKPEIKSISIGPFRSGMTFDEVNTTALPKSWILSIS